MFVKILSVGSIILGIFIIANFLFLNPGKYGYFSIGPDPSYHVGCYDINTPLNAFLEISQQIDLITSLKNMSAQVNMYDLKDQKAMSPYFQKHVYDVAKSFQRYYDQYNHQKIKSEQDLHFYTSLKNARNDFNKCKGVIQQSFNEAQCLNRWERYVLGAQQFQSLKGKLMQKVKSKQKQEKRISDYLSGFENTDVQDLQMAFEKKMNQFNKKQIQTNDFLTRAKNKKSRVDLRIISIDNDLDALKKLLKDCEDNVKVIQYCNEISDKVNTLKGLISQQKLVQRAALQKKIIEAQMAAMRKAKKIGSQKQLSQAEKSYIRANQQLKEIERQLNQLHAFEQSKCSQCSQLKMQELRKNITDLQTQKQAALKQQISFTQHIVLWQTELQQNAKAKHKAEQEFKKDKMIGGIKGCIDQDCEEQQQKFIESHKCGIDTIKSQISDLQSVFINKAVSNKQNIDEINKLIEKLESINSCLNKKEYLEKLIGYAPKKTDEGERKIKQAKSMLLQQLNDFEIEFGEL